MATTPAFAATPIIGRAQIATANTNRDGTGTMGTVATGSTNGTLINRIRIAATVTTTAGMIRLFIYDGTNTRLWLEIPVVAITPSATVAAFAYELAVSDLVLPNTYELRAATEKAETFNVLAFG